MATISQKEWKRYIARLRKINDTAAEEFRNIIIEKGGYGNIERQKLIDYAYGISTKYGEASAALSAEMYDAIAELSGANVSAAVPAETASYQEVAKTVNGITKVSSNENMLAQGVGRLVKMAGTDTILSNAYRDRPKGKGSKRKHSGAQVAWIPSGDTCPFCLMLASKGWQNQTVWGANNHSEHIHANCDCTYAVRFNDKLNVEGYDPDEYKEMYDNAEGKTRDEKFNSLRRSYYDENKDRINAQKRAAYAERTRKDTIQLRLSAISSGNNGKTVREELGFVNPARISEVIKSVNEQIRNETIEHAVVIQADGKVVHYTGDSEGVSISGVNLKGAHVTHNHPASNGIVSFGKDDYDFLRENQTVVMSCTNEAFEYNIKVVKSLDDVTYNEIYVEALKRHNFDGGEIQDETMEYLASKGYVKYEKKRIE